MGEPTGVPTGGLELVADPAIEPAVMAGGARTSISEVRNPIADRNTPDNDIVMEDTGNDIAEDPDDPSITSDDNPKFSLHPDDPQNFLKLSNALIILMKKTLTTEDISTADKLLHEYCVELITVSMHSLPTATI
jgi:hypothetical protein